VTDTKKIEPHYLMYEQPCPHCEATAGWYFRGTRKISALCSPEGEVEEVIDKNDIKLLCPALCRADGCGQQLQEVPK
jgi:hypothetical protein